MANKRRGGVVVSLPSLYAFAIVFAAAGISAPLVQSSPASIVYDARALAAQAGSALSAAVPANPVNTLAEQLRAKEAALEKKEAELQARESAGEGAFSSEMFGLISIALSVVLILLLALNFYLDARRGKKPALLSSKFSVDLR